VTAPGKPQQPVFVPKLDPGFQPLALAERHYRQLVAGAGAPVSLTLALEQQNGQIESWETALLPADHPESKRTLGYVERLLKFLLWQRGGWKLYVAGPKAIADYLKHTYSANGERAFDSDFWGRLICNRPFTVVHCNANELPAAKLAAGKKIERQWTGWRIGFDLGASDRKVAAVKDGKLALRSDGTPVISEELVWDPKDQTNPQWHFQQINEILELARSRILEVDSRAVIEAIGGSAAGVYVDNVVRMASLFRGIQPRDRFERDIAPLFKRLKEHWGNIPFRVENDGDVTALAGAIALNDSAVLGLAMGSSLAAGYVDGQGQIRGWANELAFAPVDANPDAPRDEWSGDRGVGANYFSQQAVGRLIQPAGIDMDDIPTARLPERLARLQQLMADGDERAAGIYETIGVYFGYALAHYLHFYTPVRHVEVLGRVMTGKGGEVILKQARTVLDGEFPELSRNITFYEPDEREKRHGQAAAAAYLPND
jgi:predicted NBD/HSP70 family sugar kinase